MFPTRRRAGVILLWSLGLFVAIFSARYFLDPVPFLKPPPQVIELYQEGAIREAALNIAPHALENHRTLFLTHIACGITAMVLGLFQFIASLRKAKPGVHRTIGTVYFAAIWIGSVTALPLSFLIQGAAEASVRPLLAPTSWGFAVLSVTWPAVTTMAFIRARQRRFDEHRAWMIRSYSLTFAAVTVRLVSVPLLWITDGDLLITVTASIWSWTLNLLVAEWLIRRRLAPVVIPTPAVAAP